MAEEYVSFIGIPVNEIYAKEDFRIYGVKVNEKIVNELNLILDKKYKTLTITGNIPSLNLNTEYKIKAIPTETKYGISYKVTKIGKDKPKTVIQTRKFLEEILTPRQANILLTAYPNIIDLIVNGEEIDLNKTKGIKEVTFKKIKEKIINDLCLAELIDDFSEYKITLNMIRKIYDKYTCSEKVREAMLKDPYKCLCGINRVGFKDADKIILSKHHNFLKSEQRVKSCIFYLLNENENKGNTWIAYDNLKNECKKLIPQAIDLFDECLINEDKIYKNKKKIAKKKTYYTEYYIAQTIINLLRKPKRWSINYRGYGFFNGNNLTEEQINILKQICENNICLLAGFGGTGKSFSTQAVINLLDDNGKSYMLISPTGRASQVMSAYTGKEASTIHRGLKYIPDKNKFLYNENNKLDVDIVICDETSMVDINLMKSLLEAIDTERTKLLFIFDPEQIPSVACGKVAYDMLESNIINKSILTTIFRFGEGGLYNISFKMRNGEKYINSDFRGIKNFGINKDYSIISVKQEKSIKVLKDLILKLLKEGEKIEDILITCALNKGNYGCNNINTIIQELINPYDDFKNEIKLKERVFRINDRVMQVENNYKAVNSNFEEDVIFNGDIGTITEILGDTIYVEYDKKTIIYEKNELSQLQLAYAVSIYKLQGSQVKNIILFTPSSHTFFLNKNLLYTGLTRARKKAYHICTPDVINSALKKSANYNRNTFLKDLLIELNTN
ncbi:exodeoxyribonuclease V, alpha subunit [Clostridium botulinum B str. Osaka05]|uniref:Exodeoxyribonuclease V, alpha subunit n=1 Tax=Clostridium botulinum B str. Osaka05 TaxID=1407017 RepID=A0A060N5E8_CLOBO|nr:AAA family ATPase [Clostridium botulinum]BAO04765.1 exodeoxyribonuclease V, alpha subunit [Clostridium botulinum B str. Osaka05]